MFRCLILSLGMIVAATSVQAFDCSGAVPLTCNGPTVAGTIGIPPQIDFAQCGNTTPVHHKLYTLTLATAQEVTVSLTGSAASFVEMVLFDGCDENACLAVSPPFSSVLPPVCLEAGTYTVALHFLVDVVASYEISATCESCVPVAQESGTWSAVKSSYR